MVLRTVRIVHWLSTVPLNLIKYKECDMTHEEQIAAFVERASFESLTAPVREQLKIRILDSLGCAIGALAGGPPQRILD